MLKIRINKPDFPVIAMVRSNNFTMYGIHNDLQRGVMISFNSLVALSSYIGDTAVIVGITKYNAIKLHKVLVVVILHLAVSDLLLTTFEIVPQIISLISQKWILGDIVCFLNPNINSVCLDATAGLTCLLTIYKLLIVMFPLRSRVWTARRAHFYSGLFWGIGLFQPARILWWFFTESGAIFFSFRDYTCDYDFGMQDAPTWFQQTAFYFSFGGLFTVFILLILSSILLLVKAHLSALERGRSLRWQGVVTVTATTSVFLVSNLPWFSLSVLGVFANQTFGVSTWRIVLYISNLNVMANFYVYSLTVQSFRTFLGRSVRRASGRLRVFSMTTDPVLHPTLPRDRTVLHPTLPRDRPFLNPSLPRSPTLRTMEHTSRL